MLIKFESKSNRVKGVAFHPKRPWILASLHNGTVQLWDYRMGTLIDKFEEHDGPVRGVSFHSTQPLFVSGGDDYKVKVWNYKQRRCLFTLTGHLDYVRTTVFHHEYPWILSASDDQTIRIWNWQSRSCVSILTGHSHYVMCAQFHPKDDLVVSASLDQTVRVWDLSGLRKKNLKPSPQQATSFEDRMNSNQDPFQANQDVLVKYVLEGHERGVNWASFHPRLPLIVTGADDRSIKLWRMSETKAWEIDTMRGHFNNVSCVVFHPSNDNLVLSNSEDKSIRVWDLQKRSTLASFKRETDRFWVLQAHPDMNIFAAGHDNGLIVFKLERERPPYCVHNNVLLYIRNNYQLHMYNMENGQDKLLGSLKKSSVGEINCHYRTLSFNVAEGTILCCGNQEGGSYDVYTLPKNTVTAIEGSADYFEQKDMSGLARRGPGSNAVFIARNRYVVLDKTNQKLLVRNLNNDSAKTILLAGGAVEGSSQEDLTRQSPTVNGIVGEIFAASTGHVFLSTGTSVVLYDVQQQVIVATLEVSNVKYVSWSNDNYVALLSKHQITIATKTLESLCSVQETIRIKSGCWDNGNLFVYTTLNHIKYILPQGDGGIIKTLAEPMYVVKSHGSQVLCLNRDASVVNINVDPTEYRFKQALTKKRYDEVLHIIHNSNLVGQSIIAYLRKKGYPEVAMQFVKDPITRFDLGIECGNLQVATEICKELDRDDLWQRLAQAALQQGNIACMEQALQRTRNFERLSFIYAVTGQMDKLKKMSRIAEMRGDQMSRFHNALLCNDGADQVKLLAESGQTSLAYALALRLGMNDQASVLKGDRQFDESLIRRGVQLQPPTPVVKVVDNWPLLPMPKTVFDLTDAAPSQIKQTVHQQPQVQLNEQQNQEIEFVDAATHEEVAEAWDITGDDLELDFANDDQPQSSGKQDDFAYGPSTSELWTRNTQLAVDYVAAGQFEQAMQIFKRQCGIVNFAPLKSYFQTIYNASHVALPGYLGRSHMVMGVCRQTQPKLLPFIVFTAKSVTEMNQKAFDAMTAGRLAEAGDLFIKSMYTTLLTVANTKTEDDYLMLIVYKAKEYLLGLKLDAARRQLPENDKRALELACYFSQCDMQSNHVLIALQLAMKSAAKMKCFVLGASFARRLLELSPPQQTAELARKVIAASERSPRDEQGGIYDPLNPLPICAGSLTLIEHNAEFHSCPFCNAKYSDSWQDQICVICHLGLIGMKATTGRKVSLK